MTTQEDLRIQMQNATELAEKTAIRIKMIELNRLSENPDSAITSPLSAFLRNLHSKENLSIRFNDN